MANVRFQNGSAGFGQVFNTTNNLVMGTNYTLGSTTESQSNITFNIGGTLTFLYVFITTNTITTSASTFLTRKNNTTNGNNTTSIAAAATGIFEDTGNSDTVTSGDEWNYRMITPNTSGTLTHTSQSIIFSATSNTYQNLSTAEVNGGSGFVDNATYFETLTGVPTASNTTEASAQCDMMCAGTLKNGFINISANTASVTSTLRTRKGGGNGNIVMSITSDATGIFEDTSNTDTVADGDLWCWSLNIPIEAGTNTLTSRVISIGFETTNSQQQLMVSGATSTTQNAALTRYYCNSGSHGAQTTEPRVSFTSRLSNAVAKEIEINITANTVTLASTLTFRQNATTDSLSTSITASTTGIFATTGTVTIAATDEINYKLVTGATGTSLTFRQISSLIDCTAAAAGFAHQYGVIIG